MKVAQNHLIWRWTVVVAAVLALHGAVLWALQLKLMRQAVKVAPVPVVAVIQMVVSRVEPTPVRAVATVPAATRHVAVEAKAEPKAVRKSVPAAAWPHTRAVPVPSPLLSVQPVPAQAAVPDESTAQPVSGPASAVPVQTASSALADAAQTSSAPAGSAAADAAGSPAQAGQAHVVPPSSDAAYLRNPQPDYPPMSLLRHESGTVVVRVLIGVDGRAQAAQIEKSSGYSRLDDTALTTARDRWRYRPGTRGGVPEAMWFDVPIEFTLQ
ncbi:MAG: TonB family protein [Burkholderiaceae bacterium]|jgi:protein TonB|nr:TonB family protein [Burkholderiaceae bacterium]